jgi:hypothetical protein
MQKWEENEGGENLRKETIEKEEEGRREGENEEGEGKEVEEEEGRFWVLRCRRRESKLVVIGSRPRFQPEISRI